MFAIIVPFKDEENYIGKVLECLENQVDQRFFAVFVNNFSKDNTENIIRSRLKENWAIINSWLPGKIHVYKPAIEYILKNLPSVSYTAVLDADSIFEKANHTKSINDILLSRANKPVSFIYCPHEYTELETKPNFLHAERVHNNVLRDLMRETYWFGFGHSVVFNVRLLSTILRNLTDDSALRILRTEDHMICYSMYYVDSYPVYLDSLVKTSSRRIMKSQATFDGYCYYNKQKYNYYVSNELNLDLQKEYELPEDFKNENDIIKFFECRARKLVEQHILPILVYESGDLFRRKLNKFLNIKISREFLKKFRKRNDLLDIIWGAGNGYFEFIDQLSLEKEAKIISAALHQRLMDAFEKQEYSIILPVENKIISQKGRA